MSHFTKWLISSMISKYWFKGGETIGVRGRWSWMKETQRNTFWLILVKTRTKDLCYFNCQRDIPSDNSLQIELKTLFQIKLTHIFASNVFLKETLQNTNLNTMNTRFRVINFLNKSQVLSRAKLTICPSSMPTYLFWLTGSFFQILTIRSARSEKRSQKHALPRMWLEWNFIQSQTCTTVGKGKTTGECVLAYALLVIPEQLAPFERVLLLVAIHGFVSHSIVLVSELERTNTNNIRSWTNFSVPFTPN